jgi:hypothetical protein
MSHSSRLRIDAQRPLLADHVELEGPLSSLAKLLKSNDRFEPLWSALRTALIIPNRRQLACQGSSPRSRAVLLRRSSRACPGNAPMIASARMARATRRVPFAGARGRARACSPTWVTISSECSVSRVPRARAPRRPKRRSQWEAARTTQARELEVHAAKYWRAAALGLEARGRSTARTERCQAELYDRPTCS